MEVLKIVKNLVMGLTTSRQITIRTSLDTLVDQLSEALLQTGFVICGMTDFQKEHYESLKIHHGKHKILSVDCPAISAEMLTQQEDEGLILPCSISLIELYPGEVSVIVANPTEILASISGNTKLASLARHCSALLENVVKSFEEKFPGPPDLVTSWE